MENVAIPGLTLALSHEHLEISTFKITKLTGWDILVEKTMALHAQSLDPLYLFTVKSSTSQLPSTIVKPSSQPPW